MNVFEALFVARIPFEHRRLLQFIVSKGRTTYDEIVEFYTPPTAEFAAADPKVKRAMMRVMVGQLRKQIEPHGYTINRNQGGRVKGGGQNKAVLELQHLGEQS